MVYLWVYTISWHASIQSKYAKLTHYNSFDCFSRIVSSIEWKSSVDISTYIVLDKLRCSIPRKSNEAPYFTMAKSTYTPRFNLYVCLFQWGHILMLWHTVQWHSRELCVFTQSFYRFAMWQQLRKPIKHLWYEREDFSLVSKKYWLYRKIIFKLLLCRYNSWPETEDWHIVRQFMLLHLLAPLEAMLWIQHIQY